MESPSTCRYRSRLPFTLAIAATTFATAASAQTGPATEQRFPPLQVPDGFRAALFACDPLVEYPSVIALGPEAGTLFVAADYLSGLGSTITRRDEVRLLRDTDGDGHADRATVYAEGLNSVQGLAYHRGTVYAMHAPYLSAMWDTDGDGRADERRDLLTGLGLPPEQNPPRLHCANGVVVGHDGWLYLALGDHGCDVRRPEGDRLVLEGGGILRCRGDGRDLHVFATGLRNIYDVALDAELNVFVRDNENDGGDYLVRVAHSAFGADHGYPYLYYERPDEAIPPLADLGRGSSAGGLVYEETQFPPSYRGALLFCEWGRSVVRYQPEVRGAGFSPLTETVFARGAENDPYGFKPTDLVVDRDGSLLVADWADGQSPRRGRGRIYRITAINAARAGTAPGPSGLDSESLHERIESQESIQDLAALREALRRQRLGFRGRMHAIWALARAGGESVREELFAWARSDPDPHVRAQAVRALGDLVDPVLVYHRLDAGPGDGQLAVRLAAWVREQDPRVLREALIVLGRLRWSGLPEWLRLGPASLDPTLVHLAIQALRRSGNWPGVLALADLPASEPVRAVALRALAGRAEPAIVTGLTERLERETVPSRRREYADALARVWKKPAPWTYWGYRPAPRPANTVAWEQTAAIERALDSLLEDPDRTVRLAVLRRMRREKIPVPVDPMGRWLQDEDDPERVAALLEALGDHPATSVRPLLISALVDAKKPAAVRLASFRRLVTTLDETREGRLRTLGETCRQLGRRAVVLASSFVPRSRRPDASAGRAMLIEAALGETGNPERGEAIFFDPARSRCVTCHRIGDRGERIGPDLTGVGDRFPRIHLIESVLEPSRTVAAGYQTLAVLLQDGRVQNGVKVAETAESLTLGDAQGRLHTLEKADIDELRPQAASLMPEGLEKSFSREEFVDLIAFLASLKSARAR
jgi:putative membrane-bound dehydrogenase-like protein